MSLICKYLLEDTFYSNFDKEHTHNCHIMQFEFNHKLWNTGWLGWLSFHISCIKLKIPQVTRPSVNVYIYIHIYNYVYIILIPTWCWWRPWVNTWIIFFAHKRYCCVNEKKYSYGDKYCQIIEKNQAAERRTNYTLIPKQMKKAL